MWKWYAGAAICVAYLTDVSANIPTSGPSQISGPLRQSILASEWFKRGWTLQELLAPRQIIFCNVEWSVLGLKKDIASFWNFNNDLPSIISEASGIPPWYLLDGEDAMSGQSHWKRHGQSGSERFRVASIAQRMSWASKRQTTKTEDTAYCLFGLFEVNLPLLYGEGPRAFRRLQEELVRQSNDESIFAWSLPVPEPLDSGIFASDPSFFEKSGYIHNCVLVSRVPYAITNRGVEFSAPLLQVSRDTYLLQLNCVSIGNISNQYGVSSMGPQYPASGCTIVLRRMEDGSFVRRHIRLSDLDVGSNDGGYTARCIVETLLYVHTFTAGILTLRSNPHRLAGRVRIVGNDSEWDRSMSDSWYARLQSQRLEPGMFTLQGLKKDEQQETWDRWLRFIRLREAPAINNSSTIPEW